MWRKGTAEVIGVGLAVVAAVVLIALGLASAVTTGRGIPVGGVLADVLLAFTTVAVAAVMSLITLGVVYVVVTRTETYFREEVKKRDKSYVPFIAASAGVLGGLATTPFDEDPILSI